jgi:biotin carboxyl carrier protein
MEKSAVEIVKFDKELKLLYFRHNGIFYKAKILKLNRAENVITLYLYNNKKSITLSLGSVQLSKKNKSKNNLKTYGQILSPISGRITKLYVQISQYVAADEKLVSIESMKMDNEIRAPFELFIKSVPISEGDLVKQNQLLLEVQAKQRGDAGDGKTTKKPDW